MPISSPGVGSGLDVESIITQLLAVEGSGPSIRLGRKEANIQVKLSSFAQITGDLAGLQGTLTTLKKPDDLVRRDATSSDFDIFRPTATNEAVKGEYDVNVTQLAESHKMASGAFTAIDDTVGTGTLTLRFGSYDGTETSFTANPDKTSEQIVIDTSNNTLEGVRDAINAADIGVSATIINDGTGYRLVVGSDDSGVVNGLEITAADDDLDDTDNAGLSQLTFSDTIKHMSTMSAGADAQLTVDGLAITSAKNDLTDTIEGLSIELKATGTATLSVTETGSNVKNEINKMVSTFNTLVLSMNEQITYNPETEVAGPLLGESSARSVLTTLRGLLVNPVTMADGSTLTLAEIGITTSDDGRLEVDDEAVDAYLADNYEDVAQLFSDPTNGLAIKMDAAIEGLTGDNGIITGRTDGLKDGIDQIADSRDRLADKLGRLEDRLRREFTALDVLVAQLQGTFDYVTTQLANLPGVVRKTTGK